MRLAKKPGIRGFAKSSHASMFVIGRYEVAPQTQLFGYRQPLVARAEKEINSWHFVPRRTKKQHWDNCSLN